MKKVLIGNVEFTIKHDDYIKVCNVLKGRICKILYLKEHYQNGMIEKNEIENYINTLIWDIYGTYIVFGNHIFLNCMCELEGIKENIDDIFARKKILDLANFINTIPKRSDE